MEKKRAYRLELQYDGTGLHGWAKQVGCVTVEGVLEQAFSTTLGIVPLLRVAGRTDAGVHARRQVVSLQLPIDVDVSRLLGSLNALTPRGVAITCLAPVVDAFDARRDALSRSYRYFLQIGKVESPFFAQYSWHVRMPLSLDLLRQAAALVEGLHDFTAFTPTETKHIFFRRLVLRCRWVKLSAERMVLCIEATSFLRHMVRSLVGTMVEVGSGHRSLDDFVQLLEGGTRDKAGITAPAQGLFLWDIKYPKKGEW